MSRSADVLESTWSMKRDEAPESASRSWGGVVKWGGFSLFASALVLIIYVVAVVGLRQTLPVPAREMLEDPTTPAALFLWATLGEVLLLPGGLALYFALRNTNRTLAFFATALWVLATPMFLASRGLFFAVAQVSDAYLGAGSETVSASYLSSANLALELQNIYAIMAMTVLNVAAILMGVLMLKGFLGRRIGYLVIIAGAVTLAGVLGVLVDIPIAIPIIGLVLTAAWQLTVGLKLYRLGKQA